MGPLAMYDNDRMRIDVDVAYEDDERLGCRGVYGRDEGRVTRSAGSRYEGEKSKDKAMKVSEETEKYRKEKKERHNENSRDDIYIYKNRYLSRQKNNSVGRTEERRENEWK